MAMFLAEPVQGAGGVIVPPDDYFRRIRQICDKHSVLFVSDEVITGFGRTGKMFGLEHWGSRARPDLLRQGDHVGLLSAGRRRHQRPVGRSLRSGRQRLDARLTPTVRIRSAAPWRWPCSTSSSARNFVDQAQGQGDAAANVAQAGARRPSACGRRARPGTDVRDRICEGQDDQGRVSAGRKSRAARARGRQERGLFSRLRGDVFCLAPPIVTSTLSSSRSCRS